jgi:hypothetical protein
MAGRELPQDHFCPWREEAEELRTKLGAVEDRLAALERHLFGKKSEKMPPLARQVAKKPTREETTKKRAANAAAKGKVQPSPCRTAFLPLIASAPRATRRRSPRA